MERQTTLERELMQAQLEQLNQEHTEADTQWKNDVLSALQGIQEALETQNSKLDDIATAIGNLELSPVINNNITIDPNNA